MNTAQIIIFIILGLLISFAYFKIAYTIDNTKYKTGYSALFLMMLCITMLLIIAMVTTMEMNELRTQVKNKCPEYEKIENVYKLK